MLTMAGTVAQWEDPPLPVSLVFECGMPRFLREVLSKLLSGSHAGAWGLTFSTGAFPRCPVSVPLPSGVWVCPSPGSSRLPPRFTSPSPEFQRGRLGFTASTNLHFQPHWHLSFRGTWCHCQI